MTVAVYAATRDYTDAIRQNNPKRRVSVSGILHYLGVSTSGYYAWTKHIPSVSENHRKQMKNKIQDVYQRSYQIYGAPKITAVLRQQGNTISERTTGKYMHEMGIRALWVKHWTHTTIHSDFDLQLKNILDEQFNQANPNQVWVSDITYIWTDEGFVYLTSVMDLFSRRILAWTLGTTLEAKYVVETVQKAIQERSGAKPRVFHSDRGAHYRWPGWIERMENAGLIRSMLKKGCSPDNSACEGFFGRLKNEMFYGRSWKGVTIEEFIAILDEYIHWYSKKRIKLSLGGMSPLQYRMYLGLITA